MKNRIKRISYRYPNQVTILIGNKRYVCISSEAMCRKLDWMFTKGAGFNALKWFKANGGEVRFDAESQ